jgi:hypothetical protein
MGRLSSPLYKDPDSAIFYFRCYDGVKRILLSLNNGDLLEAMNRMPIVESVKYERVALSCTSAILKIPIKICVKLNCINLHLSNSFLQIFACDHHFHTLTFNYPLSTISKSIFL